MPSPTAQAPRHMVRHARKFCPPLYRSVEEKIGHTAPRPTQASHRPRSATLRPCRAPHWPRDVATTPRIRRAHAWRSHSAYHGKLFDLLDRARKHPVASGRSPTGTPIANAFVPASDRDDAFEDSLRNLFVSHSKRSARAVAVELRP